MSKLCFDGFNDLFESGKDFTVTDADYKQKVGKDLPKDTSYLKNRSSFAEFANKHGYRLEVFDEPIIQRTVKCIKM